MPQHTKLIQPKHNDKRPDICSILLGLQWFGKCVAGVPLFSSEGTRRPTIVPKISETIKTIEFSKLQKLEKEKGFFESAEGRVFFRSGKFDFGTYYWL